MHNILYNEEMEMLIFIYIYILYIHGHFFFVRCPVRDGAKKFSQLSIKINFSESMIVWPNSPIPGKCIFFS